MKNLFKKKNSVEAKAKAAEKTVLSAQNKKAKRRKIINTICIIYLCIAMIGSVTAFVLVQNILDKSTLPTGIDGLASEQSTVLYDRNGEEITTLSIDSGVRENVEYNDLPQVVIDAFIAAEDSRFFQHSGFDLPRFISSGLANIQASGIVQGGSTLTMQLVDVAYFHETSSLDDSIQVKLEQKVVEVFKSMEIENLQTKEEIIENYLNKINFGYSARGIQKGAEYYFGKDATALTLSEAAYLAGVVNAPASYNAYNGNYEYAVERRNVILNLMLYHGYITQEEHDLAVSVDLSKQLAGAQVFETQQYQSFIDYVVEETIAVTGENPMEVPMRIYTTMDRGAQELADSLMNGEGVSFPDDLFQTGFSAINNQTGEIYALGGGRGYSSDDNTRINRAYGDVHQVGSTSKPLTSYAYAFEYLGYSTETVIEDGPVDNYTSDGGTMYNADRSFRGDVTLKEAIGLSLNIPSYTTFLRVIDTIGQPEYMKIMHSMGLLEDYDSVSGSVSIGGAEFTASPLQLAGAYQVFANKGYYQEPYAVTKIEFLSTEEKRDDYVAQSEKIKVFSEETAYLTSILLKDAVENQSYQTLVNTLATNFPVYGKSGTTDYQEEATQYGIPVGAGKDKWMVGYTSNFTVACWAGYDKAIAGMNTYLDNDKIWANVEGTIVSAMLADLTGKYGATEIARPSGVVNISHILGLFPLSTATEGNEQYMVDALINKKFDTLQTVEADDLESLSDLTITLKNNLLNLNFTSYPDADKTVAASDTKTMTAGGVSVTGKLLFDKSFLFGPVQYMWNIYINDVLITSGSGGSNVDSVALNTVNGDTVKVCGYYGYPNSTKKSNEVCKEVKSDAQSAYVVDPSFENLFLDTDSYEEAKEAVNNYISTYLPVINVQFIQNSAFESGKYDKENSTLKPGMDVEEGNTYIVAIGTKE